MKKNIHAIHHKEDRRARGRFHASGSKAFTLIELLVVVAIIGLLSSVVMYSVQSAREKAYDTKRAQDMRQLQIAAELRLLERIPIPTVSEADRYYADNSAGNAGSAKSISPDAIVKFVTLQPNEAYADSASYAVSAANYDALFVSGSGQFFKTGTTKPQDPQCVAGQPTTCYRAYYNGRTLVIVATLRTKKHNTGFESNVQYGMAVGSVAQSDLVSTCQAIGYPVYSTTQSALDPSSCTATNAGPSSIIQGISTGRDITGSTNTGSI